MAKQSRSRRAHRASSLYSARFSSGSAHAVDVADVNAVSIVLGILNFDHAPDMYEARLAEDGTNATTHGSMMAESPLPIRLELEWTDVAFENAAFLEMGARRGKAGIA